MTVRVLVIDDSAVIRMGLRSLLETFDDIEVVGEAANGRDAVEQTALRTPDVVLLDVRMPILDGVAAAAEISASSQVLMLTYSDDVAIVEGALRAGALGYLVHGQFEPADLEAAVHATAGGRSVLSPVAASALVGVVRRSPCPVEPADRNRFGLSERECEVMNLMAEGRTNHEIAAHLFINEKTVKNHINRAWPKLGVRTRGEAIACWRDTRPGS